MGITPVWPETVMEYYRYLLSLHCSAFSINSTPTPICGLAVTHACSSLFSYLCVEEEDVESLEIFCTPTEINEVVYCNRPIG